MLRDGIKNFDPIPLRAKRQRVLSADGALDTVSPNAAEEVADFVYASEHTDTFLAAF